MMGAEGLRRATQTAILNANYLAACLKDAYGVVYRGKNGFVGHEMILECYLTLSKYADNFRRISNLFKAGDITGMKNETLETSKIIRQHLEKLKR
jgi:glycine cleavage system protein P-like pyridoxal-binding family